ncbi:MAG: carbohydrate ABC transporter permease [Clostridiales Family XIII bacterium]|nr:carbohydrate ABC transporter permease [Clostridiales Family XIII bacterium]
MGNYVLAVVICAVFVFPIYWVFNKAFTPLDAINAYPPSFFPTPPTGANIAEAFQEGNIGRYILNTCVIVGLTILGSVLSCSLVAYGFARLKFRAKNALFLVLLATMMIPFDVTIVPQFILFTKIHWTNTYLPLIVPTFFCGFQGAFFVFLMRQFIMGIPLSLDEAAEIDGCNRLQTFTKIIFPMMKPVIAAVVIYQFMYAWNDFLYPLIYLDDFKNYTLTLGIYLMRTPYITPWGPMMGAAGLASLVPVTVFFLTQEKLLGGLQTSGMKN